VSQTSIFDSETPLPDEGLARREKTLLGFGTRYARVHDQLRLLLNVGQLASWNRQHHGGRLALCDLVAEQYPLVIFHGDVGTGKTAMAECMANRLVAEARSEDSILCKHRRAILIIDEGDSLAAARSQQHSHHEDKVAVNTLIQCVDDLRQYGGRIVVFLCTNRLSVVDAALQRRAAIMEEFRRPSDEERRQLLSMDLDALSFSPAQIGQLVTATGPRAGQPGWTYSDIRTRLYPAALAKAYPDSALRFEHLHTVATTLKASPVMEDR
jgi:AAA+ superfamily predicted ATPase